MIQQRFARSFPTPDEMEEFINALERYNVSKPCYMLFVNLAGYAPDLRLSLNLKNMLGEAVLHRVEDVLQHGLQPVEKKALIEIEKIQLPPRLKEVAHGLLNIHERMVLHRSLNTAMTNSKQAVSHVFKRRPLDRILRKEEQ